MGEQAVDNVFAYLVGARVVLHARFGSRVAAVQIEAFETELTHTETAAALLRMVAGALHPTARAFRRPFVRQAISHGCNTRMVAGIGHGMLAAVAVRSSGQ